MVKGVGRSLEVYTLAAHRVSAQGSVIENFDTLVEYRVHSYYTPSRPGRDNDEKHD